MANASVTPCRSSLRLCLVNYIPSELIWIEINFDLYIIYFSSKYSNPDEIWCNRTCDATVSPGFGAWSGCTTIIGSKTANCAGSHLVLVARAAHRWHGIGGRHHQPLGLEMESLWRVLEQFNVPIHVLRAVRDAWGQRIMEGKGPTTSLYGLQSKTAAGSWTVRAL
jgi:hypothetical protein